jgi:hypothetical protein
LALALAAIVAILRINVGSSFSCLSSVAGDFWCGVVCFLSSLWLDLLLLLLLSLRLNSVVRGLQC